jgi:hypothetical protein
MERLTGEPEEDERAPAADLRLAGIEGFLDHPAPGDMLAGPRLLARGWVHDRGGPPTGVLVTLGVGAVTLAHLGQPRPDVAAARPDLVGADRSGWSASLDLGHLPAGALTLSVHLVRRSGEVVLLARAVVIRAGGEPGSLPLPGGLVAAVETPTSGARVAPGPVHFEGWAHDEDGPLRSIVVSIDGAPVSVARMGLSRPDVPGYVAAAGGRTGWAAEVDVVGPATAGITVSLLRPSGQWVDIGVMELDVGQVEDGRIDVPASGDVVYREVVRVWGWALMAGMASRVDVVVEGLGPTPARIGIDRHELADIMAIPDGVVAGFECLLDLSSLPEATTSVTIGAIAHGLDGTHL